MFVEQAWSIIKDYFLIIKFRVQRTRRSRGNYTLLACKFCFPISGHVMVPQRTVFFVCLFVFLFKFRLMHVHPRAYVCIINEKTKGKFPGEHHVA